MAAAKIAHEQAQDSVERLQAAAKDLQAQIKQDEMRKAHFDFIEKDLKERGEILCSDISFLGKMYVMKVKVQGRKTPKKVLYVASQRSSGNFRTIPTICNQ